MTTPSRTPRRDQAALTGAQHYQKAQTLLGNLRREMAGSPGTPLHSPEQQSRMIAEAQAHATLALVAAQAGLFEAPAAGPVGEEG